MTDLIAKLRALHAASTPGEWNSISAECPECNDRWAAVAISFSDRADSWAKEEDKEFIVTAHNHLPEILAELERLLDENKSLQFNLEQKSKEIGRSEHRGNTVDYIYDKCSTYGRQFDELNKENTELKQRLEKQEQALDIGVNGLEAVLKCCNEKKIAHDVLKQIRRILEDGK